MECFVDDGTVHTSAEQCHVNELARVLKQLWRNNATIKMKKCVWGTDEAVLLGHKICCGRGVLPEDRKIADMSAIKKINTMGDLKSLLGSSVYLSEFNKDFADLPGNLLDLVTQCKSA